MKTERETKEKLIASARAEFMEKGYTKASLRKICANAGVTTGALYFFFDDKEDLFRAIVEPPLTILINMLNQHFTEEKQIFSQPNVYKHQTGDHDQIAERLIHHLYQNYDSFLLLLTKSHGTAFENSLDRIVDITENHFATTIEQLSGQKTGKKLNPYLIHWMAYLTIDSFIYLLTHIQDEATAKQQMKIILNFIVKGFSEMVLFPPLPT